MGSNKVWHKRIPKVFIAWMMCCLLLGCASTALVKVPPVVSIGQYNAIGVIDFNSNVKELTFQAKQTFMDMVQTSQPDVRFIPLGDSAELLASVGKKKIDSESIRLIGKKYGVSSIIIGTIEISEPSPQFGIGRDLLSLKAKLNIDGNSTVTLWDAKNGTIIWTRYKSSSWSLAKVTADLSGVKSIKVENQDSRYKEVVYDLMKWVTYDLREHYEKVPAKK